MVILDRDALECDLAETYHIFDIEGLPISKVALFSVGLREDSRIKMKMANIKLPWQTYLMASMVDKLSILVWLKTKDAEKGRNFPKSILKVLLGEEDKPNKGIMVFDTPEEFEKKLREIEENQQYGK